MEYTPGSMLPALVRVRIHAASGVLAVAIVAACSSAGPGPAGSTMGATAAGGADAPIAPGDGAAPIDADLGPCDGGLTRCGADCVDLVTDKKNCGKCGKPCLIGCSAGKCMTSCSPLEDCDGYCKDVTRDWENCKTCGNRCPRGQACVASACQCGPKPSFAADVQPIFDGSCADAACHGPTTPKGGLSLSAGKSYAALVNVKSGCMSKLHVVPGDGDLSYLVAKISGPVGICGGIMPQGAFTISRAQIEVIRAWICNGAAND